MSTFSGISTALSSLIAQRTALDVAGQNVANANTVGYTRQRANMTPIASSSVPSMFSTSDGVGGGVRVTGIVRAADAFLDAKLRTQTSSASFLAARASAYSTLENSLGEPSKNGLASQLQDFWDGWDDVVGSPDTSSTRAVLLDRARQLVDTVRQRYGDLTTQWRQARTTTSSLVDQTNALAANVADLNARIRAVEVSGGVAHELEDQRDLAITQLSSLVGATTRQREDGQIDVYVGGNALVFGASSRALAVQGANDFAQVTGYDGTPAQGVWLSWADEPGQEVRLGGGEVAGLLTVLAPADGAGTGGMLAEAAVQLDDIATRLADGVNALHVTALTGSGAAGGAFFGLPDPPGSGSPAANLTVLITDPEAVAVAAPGAGAKDSSIGQLIADLRTDENGPDEAWSRTVVEIGNRAAAASSRADVAETTRASAEQEQLANASVDTDEETINMIAAQRAYQAASRVLTTIDEMLDTLINKTGVVGR